MQSWLQICIRTECFGVMCAPSIEDKIQIMFRIYYIKKPVDKIDDYETVFPCVETMVSLTGVDIFCCKQIKQSFDLLSIRYTIMLFRSPSTATVLFHRCFSFLVKRQHNTMYWWMFFQLFDLEFFLANKGSLLY